MKAEVVHVSVRKVVNISPTRLICDSSILSPVSLSHISIYIA